MEQAYAMALWKVMEGGKEPEAAVTSLREVLERRGRTELLSRIGRAFGRFAAREHAKNVLSITLSNIRDERAHKEAISALSKLNMSEANVEVRTDDSLIGGWRLEGRGRLLDTSFKKHLLSIYNLIVK